MSAYTGTLRGYSFGCDQEWDWVEGSGLFEPGEPVAARIPVPGRHGVVPSGGDWLSGGRVVFELEYSDTSSARAANLEAASTRLRGAFAPETTTALVELTIEMASGSILVRGRPLLPLIVPNQQHHGYAMARAVFEMCDPLRYSATTKSVVVSVGGTGGGMTTPMVTPMVTAAGGSTGDAPVANDGTAPAHWSASITGGASGTVTPRLILGGQHIEFVGTVPAGSVLTVDSRERTVLLDGQPRPWVSFESSWWLIPPGQSTFSFRAVSGDGVATLTWRDASY